MILRTLRLMTVCRSPDGDGGGGGGADAGGGEGQTVPLTALQAERTKRHELETRLAAIETSAAAERERAAAEAGRYKELYEPLKAEHETAKGRLSEFERREAERTERVQARNETRIKAFPEAAAKALAPLAAKLSPEDLADWLDEHAPSIIAEAGTTRPAGTVAGNGRKTEEPIPAACTTEWQTHGKRLGITERDWFETNWKPRQKKP